MSKGEMDSKKLSAAGLDAKQIQLHQRRLQKALAKTVQTTFPILDTCRPDNGGILGQDFARAFKPAAPAKNFLAFIPAAGAASRYFSPLYGLRQALIEEDRAALAKEIEALCKQGATQWALPAPLPTLLQNPSACINISSEAMQVLVSAIDAPKALQPCNKEGQTYLQLKAIEHNALRGLCGQVFVVPPERTESFRHDLQSIKHSVATGFLEQGPALSTIRFKGDASPYEMADGSYSVVPAGHGTLIRLFSDAKKQFSAAEALFIRNIDNVSGLDADIQKATDEFLRLYTWLAQEFKKIRSELRTHSLQQADIAAQSLAQAAQSLVKSQGAQKFIESDAETKNLRTVLTILLQLDPLKLTEQLAQNNATDVFRTLFDRPLNLLGQVPNTQRDVGGTPVFVTTPHGVQKVCLELPHASTEDVKKFLADPIKATHFNPVFVAAELVTDPQMYETEDNPFWIMAAKSFQGEAVYYHETVLYELLGNNFLANALFVEVPRNVFHPHKTLNDTRDRSFSTH